MLYKLYYKYNNINDEMDKQPVQRGQDQCCMTGFSWSSDEAGGQKPEMNLNKKNYINSKT